MTQILHTACVNNLSDLISNTQQTLTGAKTYSNNHSLKLNPDKTQCIFIGSRQNIAKIPTNTAIEFEGYYMKRSIFVKSKTHIRNTETTKF